MRITEMESLRDLAVVQRDKYIQMADEFTKLAGEQHSLILSLQDKIDRKFRFPESKRKTLPDLESETIVNVLRECNGNMSVAARKLGIHVRSLYRRVEKIGCKKLRIVEGGKEYATTRP